MPQCTINGVRTEYEEQGQGKAVILLHGWGQRMIMMEPVFMHLKSHFHVFNFDFPGFGKSETPSRGWSLADYQAFLEQFCVQMGVENPILIGHSFGARVAIRYAASHPVCKMVLTGAAGIRPKPSWQSRIRTAGYKAARKAVALTGSRELEEKLKNHFGSEDYRNAQGVMRETLVKVVNEDLTDLLPRIQIPVLLVWGEKDEATPLWMGKQMEEMMPAAGLAIFEGDDHFAYFHQSDRFNRCLDIFLKEDWED